MSKYISETEAADTLSELTNQKIDGTLMKELATYGVIPAYMEFRPNDKAKYPGESFSFLADENEKLTELNCFETELQTLPFPLRAGGIFRAAEWAFHGHEKVATLQTWDYHVMALRSDGTLEPVGEQHIARLYNVPELRQWKKNVTKYLKTGRHEHAIHSCCEAFDGFDIETVGEWRGMSPFTDDLHHPSSNKASPNKVTPQSSSESRRSELIAIYTLLQLIKKLRKDHAEPELTQEKIIEKIFKILPTAIDRSTLQKLFAAANDMRDLLIIEARQRSAEQNELASLEQE